MRESGHVKAAKPAANDLTAHGFDGTIPNGFIS